MNQYEEFAKSVEGQLQNRFPEFTFEAMKTKKRISIRKPYKTGRCLIAIQSLEKMYKRYLKGETSIKEAAEDIGMIYELEKQQEEAGR